MTLIQCLTLLAAVVTAAYAVCPSADWKQYDDMCYWRSANTSSSWLDANTICPSLSPGSDLVSVHGEDLNTFLAEDILRGDSAWLGARRESDSAAWTWSDGSAFNYTYWYGGDPDWDGEACGWINYMNAGDWTGYNCGTAYFGIYFMCQIAAT